MYCLVKKDRHQSRLIKFGKKKFHNFFWCKILANGAQPFFVEICGPFKTLLASDIDNGRHI
jgi:hypothetical protein